MSKSRRMHFVIGLALLLFGTASPAQPPALINYQGRLVDGTNLVNGTVQLELSLYDAASAGTLLYTDFNSSVSVIDGLYRTYIGDDTTFGNLAAALQSPEAWLEVVVNGTPLTPRERLVSVPYAMTAGSIGAGGVGFEQLAQPYQAGLVEVDETYGIGPLLEIDDNSFAAIDIPISFTPAFSAVPVLVHQLSILERDLISITYDTIASNSPTGAVIRFEIPESVIVSAITHIDEGQTAAIVQGHPAVAGTGDSNARVLYNRSLDAYGRAFGSPTTVATGALNNVSMAIISGHPALVFLETGGTSPGIYYARAADDTGTSWPTPQLVVPTSSILPFFHPITLADVNGRPGITYTTSEVGSNVVWHVFANDAVGTTWGTPVFVDSGTGIVPARLLMAGGLPSIVFARGGGLHLRRAQDLYGEFWGGSVLVDDDAFGVFNVAVIDGNPAVVLLDGSNTEVRYRRADNAIGSLWSGTPLTAFGGSALGLALTGSGGAAHILTGNGEYMRSADAQGNDWTYAPERYVGASGARPVLLDVAGQPALILDDRYIRSGQVPPSVLNWMALQP